MTETVRLNREADRDRLRRELEKLTKTHPWSTRPISRSAQVEDYEAVEMACARLGLHREYGLDLLGMLGRKPVEVMSERGFREKVQLLERREVRRRAG